MNVSIPVISIRPALVLDIDGTVRWSKSGGNFPKNLEDIAIYSDVKAVIEEYKSQGYLILGASNQGGIAYGFRSLAQVEAEMDRTSMLLLDKDGDPLFDMITWCPFHPKGRVEPYCHESLYRKPNIGMLADLEKICVDERHALIDWPASLMVGDRQDDCMCAERAGIRFEWAQKFFCRQPYLEGTTVTDLDGPEKTDDEHLFTVVDQEWTPIYEDWRVKVVYKNKPMPEGMKAFGFLAKNLTVVLSI